MLRIILIRPGSTDYDQQQRIQGTLDIPLSEQGRLEVSRAVEELRDQGLETVYAPCHQPSQETGKAVAKGLGIKCKKIEKLQNLDHGLWQGMLVKDVRKKQPKVYRKWQEHPESVCPPEGETLTEADDRVRSGVTKLLKRHKEGVIGLVVPEPLASLVRRFIHQGELGDLWKKTNGHGHWEVLQVEPEELLVQTG